MTGRHIACQQGEHFLSIYKDLHKGAINLKVGDNVSPVCVCCEIDQKATDQAIMTRTIIGHSIYEFRWLVDRPLDRSPPARNTGNCTIDRAAFPRATILPLDLLTSKCPE